jgi:hypothetical protein
MTNDGTICIRKITPTSRSSQESLLHLLGYSSQTHVHPIFRSLTQQGKVPDVQDPATSVGLRTGKMVIYPFTDGSFPYVNV